MIAVYPPLSVHESGNNCMMAYKRIVGAASGKSRVCDRCFSHLNLLRAFSNPVAAVVALIASGGDFGGKPSSRSRSDVSCIR
jgi:hypothetical protein